MKMIKKGSVVKFLSMGLAVAIIAGGVIFSNIKSHASEENIVSQSSNTKNKEVEEYIKKLRKMDSEIIIYNIDDLYKRLDEIENITNDKVEEVLACSSDDVIVEFIENEEIKS